MSDSSNEPEIRGELAKKIANQTWDEFFPAPVLRAACIALCSDQIVNHIFKNYHLGLDFEHQTQS